jgi:transposase-like protein
MQPYSSKFKIEAVKRVATSGLPIARVAAELDVNENTLHGGIKRYREKEGNPSPGSGKLSDADAKMNSLLVFYLHGTTAIEKLKKTTKKHDNRSCLQVLPHL